jgi:hypothetical protein
MGLSNRISWTVFCATLFLTMPASAQLALITESECAHWSVVGNYLTNFDESPLALGDGFVYIVYEDKTVREERGVYSLWTNQETGTFTNTITFEDGITCILVSGSKFDPYVETK